MTLPLKFMCFVEVILNLISGMMVFNHLLRFIYSLSVNFICLVLFLVVFAIIWMLEDYRHFRIKCHKKLNKIENLIRMKGYYLHQYTRLLGIIIKEKGSNPLYNQTL